MKYKIVDKYVNTSDSEFKAIEVFKDVIFMDNVFLSDRVGSLTFENCIFLDRLGTSTCIIEGKMKFKNCIFKLDTCLEIIAFQDVTFKNNIFKKGFFLMDSEIRKNIRLEENIFQNFTDINQFGNGAAGRGSLGGKITLKSNYFKKENK